MIPKIKSPFFKTREVMSYLNKDKVIKNQVKKNKSIIYGAQSVKKQIGFLARPTKDYDILTVRPKRSARRLTKKLNRKSGSRNYYMKPALHPGTYKVQHIGFDKKRDTDDDEEIADFTKSERKVKTTTIEGIKYSHLSETIKDKKKSLRDPEYAFRHEKDRDDLQRIKLAKQMKIKYRR